MSERPPENLDPAEQRRAVRERYGRIATGGQSCGDEGCCEDSGTPSEDLGYSESDLAAVDPDAVLGLGCGNPTGIAGLETGETVMDLGSGAGFDCFLAARAVGPSGRVVGVDMTPEMVEKARDNAAAVDNVEFGLGEIEHLPVADESVDVVLSNCVVNLSPDESAVFREAYRVLVPGGRLAISDVVTTAPVPDELRSDPTAVAACVAGASSVPELERTIADAGFTDVSVAPEEGGESVVRDWDPDRDLSDYLVPATLRAEKPATDLEE